MIYINDREHQTMNTSANLRAAPTVAKRDSWKNLSIKNEIDINLPTPKGNRILTVSTYKGSRGLVTTATVGVLEPSGIFTHAIGFGVCGDFSATLVRNAGVRATEKALRSQQEAALLSERGMQIVEEARAWYEQGLNIHPADRARRALEAKPVAGTLAEIAPALSDI